MLAGVRQRAKLVQEERDALEAKKAVAEAYLAKERERLVAEATLFHIFIYDGEARSHRTLYDTITLVLKDVPSAVVICSLKITRCYSENSGKIGQQYRATRGEVAV